MNLGNLAIRERSASEDAIRAHLLACNKDFVPRLDSRVKIEEYAKKLHERAVTFEAWADDLLVGLVAVYFDSQQVPRKVFISSVSVLSSYASRGVARRLIERCVERAVAEKAAFVELEVSSAHQRALRLYSRIGFVESATSADSTIMRLQILNMTNYEQQA